MDPEKIIGTYYEIGSKAHRFLTIHARMVADKALIVANHVRNLNPDLAFIEEGALLHDIGMIMTDVPQIGCHGIEPYVRHGVLGRKMLEDLGYPKHALVCERHLVLGLSAKAIRNLKLPLPVRDMRPVTLEEKIICYADKFYSKGQGSLEKQKTMDEVEAELKRFSEGTWLKFKEWSNLFEPG